MPLSPNPEAVVAMSWTEYEAWDDPQAPYGEYLDGVYVMAPRPNEWHQELEARLLVLLREVVVAPYLAVAEVEWTPQGKAQAPAPDVIVYWLTGAGRAVRTPVLAVEILSRKRNYDLEYKRDLYAAWGLPTYWIVDPPNRALRVHELSGDELVETGSFVGGLRELTFGPFAVTLDLDALFAQPPPSRL